MKITNQGTPNLSSEKKVYSHLFTSPFSDRFKPSISSCTSEKKIVVTTLHCGLREEFKKMFLPLLIDIFELRQLIDTYKLQKQSRSFQHLGKASKTPEEIMVKLREMQADIEESQGGAMASFDKSQKASKRHKKPLIMSKNKIFIWKKP